MRLLTIITSLALAALTVFAVMNSSPFIAQSFITQQDTTQHCQQLKAEAEQHSNAVHCQLAADQVTWLSWLTGDSRSVQFHFFDLVELISGSGDSSKKHYQSEYTD